MTEAEKATKEPQKKSFRSFFHKDGETTFSNKEPQGFFFTDLHLNNRRSPFFNQKLDLLPFKRKTKYYFQLGRLMFKLFCRQVVQKMSENDVVVFGGDISDTFETGAFFEAMTFLETNMTNPLLREQKIIWLTGNHDTAFAGQDQFGLKNLRYKYGDIPLDEYREIVSMIKSGSKWKEVLKYWREKHNNQPLIIHPALRWYLLKLYFGPSIGRILVEKDTEKIQIVFLNSQLYSNQPNIINHKSESGTAIGLSRALNEIGLTEDDQLAQDMLQLIQQETETQQELIKQVEESRLEGTKTIIYTHDFRLIWHILEQMVSINNTNPIVIYSGHYHLAQEEPLFKKVKEKFSNVCVIPVPGMSRHIIGPFAQKPGGKIKRYTLSYNPYKYTPPAYLQGHLTNPEQKKINYERIFHLLELIRK